MIVSQTPYRIGLIGGGTDLPGFCAREPGAVVNVAIDKHFYVSACPRFEDGFRIAYSRTERVAAAAAIRHDLVRAGLCGLGIDRPLEIAMTGEIPAGSGLGSSSAVAVGLLNVLTAIAGHRQDEEALARLACRLELDWLGKIMGRQDQFGCAIGGFKLLRFRGEAVEVRRLHPPAALVTALAACTLILYVGPRGSNAAILCDQNGQAGDSLTGLRRMRDLALAFADRLEAGADIAELGRMIDESWQLKRSFSPLIADDRIDALYRAARRLGAWGGKLLGAGGRGFLLLLAPPDRHDGIARQLRAKRRLPFAVSPHGTRIVFEKPVEWRQPAAWDTPPVRERLADG